MRKIKHVSGYEFSDQEGIIVGEQIEVNGTWDYIHYEKFKYINMLINGKKELIRYENLV